MRTKTLYIFIIALVLLLTGSSRLMAQDAVATPQADTYHLRKGDKISVKFAYHQELNEPSVVIRPDGYIGLQLIEDVAAEGLTATELRHLLEKEYDEVLLKPVISVSVIEFLPPRIFVGGQVQKAGRYELREAQTLLQALLSAGGFTNEADKKLVLHARPVNDHELVITQVDVTKLLGRKSTGMDITLRDGDYIFVPDSKLAKFTRVMSAFQNIVPGASLLR